MGLPQLSWVPTIEVGYLGLPQLELGANSRGRIFGLTRNWVSAVEVGYMGLPAAGAEYQQ